MRIATYNVNGINARLPVLLRWLAETSPDVACLQELKAPQNKFPLEAIPHAGYQAIWKGQKSWNGVAMLTPCTEFQEIRRTLPGEQSRYLEALVDGVLIGCPYLPNGNPAPGPKFEDKLRWFDRFIRQAAHLLETKTPAILAGDFTVISTELDAATPQRWGHDALFRGESRAAYAKLPGLGWIDSLRQLAPCEQLYTSWDYFGPAYRRNDGLRIDHILTSSLLAGQMVEGGVDRWVRGWEKTSDHAPVWIKLVFPFQ